MTEIEELNSDKNRENVFKAENLQIKWWIENMQYAVTVRHS
jgi:hypothetical protein